MKGKQRTNKKKLKNMKHIENNSKARGINGDYWQLWILCKMRYKRQWGEAETVDKQKVQNWQQLPLDGVCIFHFCSFYYSQLHLTFEFTLLILDLTDNKVSVCPPRWAGIFFLPPKPLPL